jgi:hypothetical protein
LGAGASCCIALAARLGYLFVPERRQLAILIALLVTLGLDAAWATPLRAAKQARSAVCCARNCGNLRTVACDSGCCPTARSPDSPALSAPGKQDRTGPVVVGEQVAVLAAVCGSDRDVVPLRPDGNDPPSIFLLTRTLRL